MVDGNQAVIEAREDGFLCAQNTLSNHLTRNCCDHLPCNASPVVPLLEEVRQVGDQVVLQNLEQGVQGDAVPLPEREVSSLHLLFFVRRLRREKGT